MRYIDADALIQALCADNDGIGRADAKAVMTCLEDVFSIVDDAPSIDIVFCKECKWDSECRMLDDDNGYCSQGEVSDDLERLQANSRIVGKV